MFEGFFPAEVTVLSQEALKLYIMRNYDIFKDREAYCRLYYRSLHDTYRVASECGTYFFKVYRQNMRSAEEIQAEIDLLEHLKESGIPAVYALQKNDGAYISEFQTANGVSYGVLFMSVGVRGFEDITLTDKLNEETGAYIAKVHTAWDHNDLKYHRWNLDTETFIDIPMQAIREFSKYHTMDIGFLETVAANLKIKIAYLAGAKPKFGICHGDIYSGNLRLDENNRPILFDFDFCGNGWRAYDVSLYAYPFGMGCDPCQISNRESRKEQFLNGYNSVRAMDNNEIKSIELFIPFRRIFNIGMLYISWLQNTWGESAVIRNVNEDIIMLKKWLEINPVL